MRGSPTSTRAISGGSASRASRPATPSCATRTRWPASSSSRLSVSAASALSSTIRILRVPDSSMGLLCVATRVGAAMAGRRTVNSLPCPGPPLAAMAVPPCSSARRRTRVKPIPRPPRARSSGASPWTKSSNTRSVRSADMPTPVSRIEKTASSRSCVTLTQMVPPPGVNFTALPTRLATICSRRVGSAWTHAGLRSFSSLCAARRPPACRPSKARRTTSERSRACRSSTILPRMARPASSKSSVRRPRCSTWRAMTSRARRIVASSLLG